MKIGISNIAPNLKIVIFGKTKVQLSNVRVKPIFWGQKTNRFDICTHPSYPIKSHYRIQKYVFNQKPEEMLISSPLNGSHVRVCLNS